MKAMSEFVRLEVEDGVGTIRLDRPKLNAINDQVAREIAEAAREAAEREDVGAVVVWGGERIFAAGADVKMMSELSPAEAGKVIDELQDALNLVEDIPKVVIAAINGYALGGGYELALCADLRYAADTAKLGQPEIQLGIIPGAGGTQRLPRLIGLSRAKELIYSGRQVRAEEALAIGMADRILPADQVYAEAVEDARTYATGPRVALAAAKHAIDAGMRTDLRSGLRIERDDFVELFDTKDQKIGMRSLLENGPGKAEFEGK
jgi:enoyl-CoA hydratase/carnithine racemase